MPDPEVTPYTALYAADLALDDMDEADDGHYVLVQVWPEGEK